MSLNTTKNRAGKILTLSVMAALPALMAAPALAGSNLLGAYQEIYTYGAAQGSPYTSFAINENNQVAFGDSTLGIFTGSTAANTTNVWPIYWGTGTGYGEYANNAVNPAINDAGDVMVSGMTYISGPNSYVSDGTNSYALPSGLEMSGAIEDINGSTAVLYPDYVPGYSGGHANSAFTLYTPARGLTDDGYISFEGGYNNNTNHGVFYGNGNDATTVTVATDTGSAFAPNGGIQFTGNLDNTPTYADNTFNVLAINGTGASKEVLFRGSLATGGAQEGLYLGNGTSITTIATTVGGAYKGFANSMNDSAAQTYAGFLSADAAIDKKGDVAYRAILSNGTDALDYYNASTGTSTQLAVATPGVFNVISSISINNNGLIAVGTAEAGISDAVWMYNLATPSLGLQEILATGDTFDGKTIGKNSPLDQGYDIDLADGAYNDSNNLALAITYTDPLGNGQDISEVYVLDPSPAVPEPATLSLLGLGAFGLLSVRRRTRIAK